MDPRVWEVPGPVVQAQVQTKGAEAGEKAKREEGEEGEGEERTESEGFHGFNNRQRLHL